MEEGFWVLYSSIDILYNSIGSIPNSLHAFNDLGLFIILFLSEKLAFSTVIKSPSSSSSFSDNNSFSFSAFEFEPEFEVSELSSFCLYSDS